MMAFKYKLYPNDHTNIDHQINVACFIYNHCIILKRRFYRKYKKSISDSKLKRHLAKIKHRKRFGFFGELNSQTVQDICERIEKGYKAFFKKTSKHPPSFKGKIRYNSITFKQTGYKYIGENKITIMGKTFSFFLSRPIEGKIKTVTIKRNSLGDHYICFVTDFVKKKSKPATCHGCGFDFGLKTFLTISNGEKIESPLFLKQSLQKLKTAQKSLSRKVKGSKSRNRARLCVARLHMKVTNQRLDFMFKLSKELVEKYEYLCFEDLNLEGMKKLWGRKVSDSCFGKFLEILKYRCLQYDRELVQIGRFEPSTKECHLCGHIVNGLTLSDRSWICPDCGENHDRDVNAAKVILKKSGRSLSESLGVVRPVLALQEQASSV